MSFYNRIQSPIEKYHNWQKIDDGTRYSVTDFVNWLTLEDYHGEKIELSQEVLDTIEKLRDIYLYEDRQSIEERSQIETGLLNKMKG